MSYYTAFGLILDSEFEIPDFLTHIDLISNASEYVTLKQGVFPLSSGKPVFLHRPWERRRIWKTPEGVVLYWRGVGAFLVEKGNSVIVQITSKKPRPGFTRAVIIGPALGILLYQRQNHFLFHSSVVGKEDISGAVCFMAKKGGGKSSLAVSMINHGYRLVSDDLLAVQKDTLPTMVQPGFPGLKLWQSSAAALVKEGDALPKIGPGGDYEKRSLINPERFTSDPLPLKAVFILEYDNIPRPVIIPLDEKEAFIKVLPHWYGAQFNGQLLPVLGLDRHFNECSALIKSTPVFKLIRPRNLRRMQESVETVHAFLEELSKDQFHESH